MTAASITVEKDEDEWRDEGWTATPNRIIRDPSLEEGEKWAWSWFASHTDTFRFDLDDMAEDSPSGRNIVREYVRGLERKGLLTRHQERDNRGRIVAVRYKLHLRPVAEERRTFVESTAKKRVMTEEAKTALRRNRSSEPAPAREGAGDPASADSADSRSSEPAPARPGAGGPGAGEPGAGRAGLSYKEEKTTGEHQEDTTTSTAPPPSAERPAKPKQSKDEPRRDDVEQLCARLRDRMIGNGCKPPTITDTWRTSARLLLDKDGRDLTKALNLLDWATADEFWMANIQSIGKFRAQYDTLRLRAIQEHKQKQRGTSGAPRRSQTAVAMESTRSAFDQYRAELAAQQPAARAITAGSARVGVRS